MQSHQVICGNENRISQKKQQNKKKGITSEQTCFSHHKTFSKVLLGKHPNITKLAWNIHKI
jgi:hypothetical protein